MNCTHGTWCRGKGKVRDKSMVQYGHDAGDSNGMERNGMVWYGKVQYTWTEKYGRV